MSNGKKDDADHYIALWHSTWFTSSDWQPSAGIFAGFRTVVRYLQEQAGICNSAVLTTKAAMLGVAKDNCKLGP